jgi:hypothetical protein
MSAVLWNVNMQQVHLSETSTILRHVSVHFHCFGDIAVPSDGNDKILRNVGTTYKTIRRHILQDKKSSSNCCDNLEYHRYEYALGLQLCNCLLGLLINHEDEKQNGPPKTSVNVYHI